MPISSIKYNNLPTNINFETDTIDVFGRGSFFLVQPKKMAHKAGLDAMLLASCVPDNFKGKCADFGSGAGAAALAVLARCSQAHVTLIENSDIMVEYAKKTLSLPENYNLAKRANIVQANITAPGKERQKSGLQENSFDFIIMNPPYNNSASNQSKYELRALAHVKTKNLFEDWLKTAACSLKAKGYIAIIAKSCSLYEILAACNKRFGNINIYPIYPHQNTDNLRLLFVAQKNSLGATKIKAPIYIREQDTIGNFKITQKINNITNVLCNIEA